MTHSFPTRRSSDLPAELRARAIGMMQATVAERRPLRLRLSDINDVRLPLFFFSVSTEIAAAFLPLYARAASRPEWLSPEIAAAAPLVLYLLAVAALSPFAGRSEEHTSELQSLMRISYAVFCLKKKKTV